jgi:hypothetical protein
VPLSPEAVIPEKLARAVAGLRAWFVIGGHAVRCFCPYRASRDVDLGVALPRDRDALVAELRRRGTVELLERTADTTHLRFDGIDVSIFVVPKLSAFVEDRRLSVTGILATKLHAILDRGTRRDFFDLYVTLQMHGLGLAECLTAMRTVHGPEINDALLLRALSYFDDAEREAALPREGPGDWRLVKDFFRTRAGQLVLPPLAPLAIQTRRVEVRAPPVVRKRRAAATRRRPPTRR